MTLGALHHCADRMAFRESVGFAAGQSYERRRIGELLRQRISDLRRMAQAGLPRHTMEALAAELELMCAAIDKEAA